MQLKMKKKKKTIDIHSFVVYSIFIISIIIMVMLIHISMKLQIMNWQIYNSILQILKCHMQGRWLLKLVRRYKLYWSINSNQKLMHYYVVMDVQIKTRYVIHQSLPTCRRIPTCDIARIPAYANPALKRIPMQKDLAGPYAVMDYQIKTRNVIFDSITKIVIKKPASAKAAKQMMAAVFVQLHRSTARCHHGQFLTLALGRAMVVYRR